MRRISLTSLSTRDWLWVIGPAIVLVIAAFWAASKFIEPAPPRSYVLTAGEEDGPYYQFAKRYKDILAREGVTIEIRTSAGSTENLARLPDPDSDVQVGFVQRGIAAGRDTSGLMSLGSLYYEPLPFVRHVVFISTPHRGSHVMRRLCHRFAEASDFGDRF